MDIRQSAAGVPQDVRNRVLDAMKAACKEGEEIPMEVFPNLVLKPANVQWREYSAGSKKMGEWLDKYFPELERSPSGGSVHFKSVSQQGSVSPSHQAITPEVRNLVSTVVNEALRENQAVLLADLGTRLLDRGIDRHAYTNEGLADWLIELFPSLSKSGDGKYLFSGKTPPPPAVVYPPAAGALLEADLDRDIRQMHGIAFMGWWSNNIRTLKRYTGCNGSDTRVWSGIVAQRISAILLGQAACIQGHSPDGSPRFAFYSGMDAADGRPIYCVMVPNKIKSARQQPMMLEAFCCPDDEDRAELGEWLGKSLSQQVFQQTRSKRVDMSLLESHCTQVETLGRGLAKQVETFLQALRDGAELPSLPTAGLEAYEAAWKNAASLRARLEVPEDLTSAGQILSWCAEQNEFTRHLKQMDLLFSQLQQILLFILECYGISFDADADLAALRDACNHFSAAPSMEELHPVLAPYRQLLQVMEAQSVTPELLETTSRLDRHFGFRSMQLFCLKLQNAPHYHSFQQKLSALDLQLSSLDAVVKFQDAPDGGRKTFPPSEELLSDICHGKGDFLWTAGGGENRLESLVLGGQLPEAAEFASNPSAMSDLGYDEETRLEILQRLDPARPFPQERTLYGAGRRLSMVFGDQNPSAERCFLLGMFPDRNICGPELLTLYAQTGQSGKFSKIWTRFEPVGDYNAEHHIFYIHLLKGASAAHIRAYLDRHVFLYYLPETIPAILSIAEDPDLLPLRQELSPRLEALQTPPERNPLEQALMEGRNDKIPALLDNREFLLNLGYSEEQVLQISQAAVSDVCPTGSDPYQTGMRIYLFQGNLRRLAEEYLWHGLARHPSMEQSDTLIQLLANEQRWAECVRLYTCYRGETAASADSRQCYLLSMLHIEPIRTQQLIRSNLQDCLSLIYHNPAAAAAVDRYRNSSNESFRDFYQRVHGLGGLLTEDYPRSVILHNRSLRDMVTQPDLYAKLGLSDRQMEQAKALYLSGNYPQGTDAVSVAKRAYAFIGAYRGIAETLGRFALPAEEAAKLLWDIYASTENVQEQRILLQDYPVLQKLHPEEYGQHLFATNQNEQFLEWSQQREVTPLLKLQQAVAQLRLNPHGEIELPALEEPLTPAYAGGMIHLARALAQAQRFAELEDVLFPSFDLLLKTVSPEDLRRILSADGALTVSAAQAIQKDALDRSQIPVALYYYNILEVGQLSSMAEQYYQQCLENGGVSEKDGLEHIVRLAKLYPNRRRELDAHRIFLQVSTLLERKSPSPGALKTLVEILDSSALDPGETRRLISAVQRSPYAGDPAVFQSVARITDNDALLIDGLVYLHQAALSLRKKVFIGEGEETLYTYLCQRYLDALSRGRFPSELLGEAEQLCQLMIRMGRGPNSAVFCLYQIELLLDQRHKAEYALRYLATQPANSLDKLYTVVESETESLWNGKIPSIPDQFRALVQEAAPEDILAYCRFCRIFSEATSDDRSAMHAQIQSLRQQKLAKEEDASSVPKFSPCTESNGEALVKVLYSNPDKADYWLACTSLPNLTPEVYGKLLYLCSVNNPYMWQECVSYCVQYEFDALLIMALHEWAHTQSPGPKNCRSFLDSALSQDPNFFCRWSEEEEKTLLDILRLLCEDIQEDIENMPSTVTHSALTSISSIAVGLGSDEAFQLMTQFLYGPLITTNSEVGTATVLRLLLSGSFRHAQHLLEGLTQSASPIACHNLVASLAGLDATQLEQWAQARENQLLAQLLLPDGNRPTTQAIQQFAIHAIQSGAVQEGAAVLNKLLDIFPGDYACCDALFILCKCGLENPILLLHRSLCGLIASSANGVSYYRRDYIRNAKLLAGVNAVIRARHLEHEVEEFSGGYDFNQPTGNYCLLKKPETTTANVNAINQFQRDLSNDLANHQADVLERKCQAILCWVTGNWGEFLYEAWRRKEDPDTNHQIRDCLCLDEEDSNSSIGFCRGLLLAMERMEEQEWEPFLTWVQTALPPGREDPWTLGGKLRQLHMARDIAKNQVCKKAGDLPLSFPLEEYSLFPFIYEEAIAPHIGKNAEPLFYRLWLLGAIADYPTMIKYQYLNSAQMSFRTGDDITAVATYSAMQKLLQRGLTGSTHISVLQFHRYNAQFEACARVSRLMLGDQEMISRVSSPRFHLWSCINMTVVLLCSPRGNRAMWMSMRFAPMNCKLSQAIIKGINPDCPDEEKLQMLHTFPDGLHKAYLAHIMSIGNNKGIEFKPYFFSSSQYSWEVKALSQELAKKHSSHFSGPSGIRGNRLPKHTLLTTFALVNPASYLQLAVNVPYPAPAGFEGVADALSQEAETASSRPVPELPSFAREPFSVEPAADLAKLKSDYKSLPRLKRYYLERLRCSAQIYHLTAPLSSPPEGSLPALINFGLDYYDYHMNQDISEELTLANRAIIELVLYTDAVKASSPIPAKNSELASGIRLLETTIDNAVIHNLLDKGHMTIHSLMELFAQNRRAFALMQDMVQADDLRKTSTETIFSALDHLVECYSNHGGNHDSQRKGLLDAQAMISSITYSAWQLLKNRLQSLIQNELNSMDRRPILSVRISNLDQNPAKDYLYGYIQNDGLEAAEDITIQVTYDNTSFSQVYRLSRLEASEQNVFRIPYKAPPEVTFLRYRLNCSHMFNGQPCNKASEEGSIPITEVPEPTFPLRQYETQTITDFTEDENGNLVNPDFFGRDKETSELRNLFRSGRFPSYNSAILYGIRRAGKTSLLNYVQKYVSLRCEDAIAVKVDCLNNASPRLVQSLFIDRVLDAIQGRYPAYRQSEDWQQLRQDWEMPPDATADRAPEKLELFYQELKHVTGKGLILMLDEVDNFFAAVERQTSLDSYLFQVLSNMLCSPSCQEAIHFIFCGSKYLLRYRTGDGSISQLFQRFGSNIIEVGLIPKDKMEEMLSTPYRNYPEVRFTSEAIEWIWMYTRGLVWHIKLLANAVLQYVKDNHRSIVYPTDVKSKIQDIAQKEYCEQFFDGINAKDQDKYERLVIDAMQSLSSTFSACISKNILLQLLTSEGLAPEYRMSPDQLETALSNLIKLRLLNYSEANKGYYFPVDLYRLYFRTQQEYPFIFKKISDIEPSFIPVQPIT